MIARFFDDVWNVIEDFRLPNGAELWPVDETSQKRDYILSCYKSGQITLLVESNQLTGFLLFRRVDKDLECDFLWIRPELRRRGVLKRLIHKAVSENRLKIYPSGRLFFQKVREPLKTVSTDFKKFYRRFA
jgi:hypothetical protein